MISIEDIFKLKDKDNNFKKNYKLFFKEPLAFRMSAEKGWRSVIYAFVNGKLTIDIIPILEWGYFTSFKIASLNPEFIKNSSLIRYNQDILLPLIPDSYSGILNNYFNDIKAEVPEWNRVPPTGIILGCLSPSDTRSFDELERIAMNIYQEVEKINSTINKTNISPLFPHNSLDKDKLN